MLALLRMKLRCPNVLFMHDRGEFDLIVCCCENDPLRLRLDVVRMHKVNKATVLHPLRKAVCLLCVQLVPAHMRDTKVRRQLHYSPVQEVEAAVMPEFFAFGKKKVHAEANSQRRRSGFDLLNKGT